MANKKAPAKGYRTNHAAQSYAKDKTLHDVFCVRFTDSVGQQTLKACAKAIEAKYRSRQPPLGLDWGMDYGDISGGGACLILDFTTGGGQSAVNASQWLKRVLPSVCADYEVEVVDKSRGGDDEPVESTIIESLPSLSFAGLARVAAEIKRLQAERAQSAALHAPPLHVMGTQLQPFLHEGSSVLQCDRGDCVVLQARASAELLGFLKQDEAELPSILAGHSWHSKPPANMANEAGHKCIVSGLQGDGNGVPARAVHPIGAQLIGVLLIHIWPIANAYDRRDIRPLGKYALAISQICIRNTPIS